MAEKTFEIIGFMIFALVAILILAYWMYGPDGIAQFLGFDPFEPLEKLFAQFFGGSKEMVEYQKAKYSAKAVWCAVMVASRGNINDPCLAEFTEEIKNGFKVGDMEKENHIIQATGKADARSKCTVKCTRDKIGCKPEIVPKEGTNEFECIIRWSKTGMSGGAFFKPVGLAVAPAIPTIDTNKEPEYDEDYVGAANIECRELGGTKAVDFIDTTDKDEAKTECNEMFGDKAMAEIYEAGVYRCMVPEVSCTIDEFILPQRITDAEEHIAHYGDPLYLIYWEEFPKEWDTWTYEPDWKMHLLIGTISVFPFGKIGGMLFKGSVNIAKGGRAATALAASLKTAPGVTDDAAKVVIATLKSGGGKVTDKSLKAAIRTAMPGALGPQIDDIALAASKSMGKHLGYGGVKEILKRTFSAHMARKLVKYPLKHPIRVLGKFVAGEAALLLVNLVESMSHKYEPVGNSIVLKIPFLDPDNFELTEGWEGKPVVVKWNPGAFGFEKTTRFHLVSPCKISKLDITQKYVECSSYSYNWKEKATKCTYADPDESDWGIEEVSSIEKSRMCRLKSLAGIDTEKLDKTNTRDFIHELFYKDYSVETIDIEIGDEVVSKKIPLTELPSEDDTLGMSISTRMNGNDIIFRDADGDGFLDTFTVLGCQAPAIEVWADVGGVASWGEMDGDYDDNYCLNRKYEVIEKPTVFLKNVALYIGMGGGLIVAGVSGIAGFFYPPAWLVTAGSMKVFTASAIASGVFEIAQGTYEYTGIWPS
ncbi:MAG: hypothetical protein ISS36_01540 [Candidatus Aenigmarchaeota archaeon]|nr:hypothetical protein [Candidatus Aenigmarchaeota archaeon]